MKETNEKNKNQLSSTCLFEKGGKDIIDYCTSNRSFPFAAKASKLPPFGLYPPIDPSCSSLISHLWKRTFPHAMDYLSFFTSFLCIHNDGEAFYILNLSYAYVHDIIRIP